MIGAEGARLLRETLESTKCGGGSNSPDKHKMNGRRRRCFAFLDHLAYDLEGLAAVAGQVRPRRALARGGSPPAPRKASTWSGNQPPLASFKETMKHPSVYFHSKRGIGSNKQSVKEM
ncbi:hypothetical protein [Rossellomorea sp. SC111]|uniref:hypothetical protein n=1 Tax=Rossellomorea sp. SC111 TaxID=2968985 RepID=UPI00215AF337|nr:hypothetical protein [Rossellomorea sp. SC111]